MGCAASKPEGGFDAPDALLGAGLPGAKQGQGDRRKSASGRLRPVGDVGFACFLSHFKTEAATEARWLQGELEQMTEERCFLDSDE